MYHLSKDELPALAEASMGAANKTENNGFEAVPIHDDEDERMAKNNDG